MRNPAGQRDNAAEAVGRGAVVTVGLTGALRELYTNGDCSFLAVALHERFGLPIEAAVTSGADYEQLEHAWVVDGDRGVDANGSHPLQAVRERYSGKGWGVTVSLSADRLLEIVGAEDEEEAMLKARRVVARFYGSHQGTGLKRSAE